MPIMKKINKHIPYINTGNTYTYYALEKLSNISLLIYAHGIKSKV